MRSLMFWGECIFLDECSIWFHDNNHLGWFNNKDDDPLCVDKHTGKLHVWAASSIFGKVNLFIFKENLLCLVFAHSTYSAHSLCQLTFPYAWVLVQDNSPTHKREAKEVLLNEVPYSLNWAAKSPDMMPIENLGGIMKNNVRKSLPTNIFELENAINNAWNSIDDIVSNIACSFKFRTKTLYNRKGHKLNY